MATQTVIQTTMVGTLEKRREESENRAIEEIPIVDDNGEDMSEYIAGNKAKSQAEAIL